MFIIFDNSVTEYLLSGLGTFLKGFLPKLSDNFLNSLLLN